MGYRRFLWRSSICVVVLLMLGLGSPGWCSDPRGLVTSSAIKVLAPDGAAGDYFGLATDIDGNQLIVGAYYAHIEFNEYVYPDAGAAYIFRRNQVTGDGWDELVKLEPPSPYFYDNFGVSVAISGDTAVVGTMESYGGGTAYVYERNEGGIDAWGLTATLIGNDTEEDDYFGRAVAIDGDTIIVGAYGDDDGGSSAGAAYVFRRNPDQPQGWEEIAKLTASDAAANEWYGFSVGVSGDTVVVGCQWDGLIASNAGAAYVYERNNGGGADDWAEVTKVVASDPDEWDMFGRSIAIDGSLIVIGAYQDDEFGDNAGAAYVFERNTGGADAWGQIDKIRARDSAAQDKFGSSVAVDDSTVVVGALGRDQSGVFEVGAVYVFERNQGGADAWGQVTRINPSVAAYGELGSSVAIDGTFIAAGASRDNNANGNAAGAAWVYLRDGDRWMQEASPRPLDGADDDFFGTAVGISNDVAIVGAIGDDDSAIDAGSAYILERNQGGMNAWLHIAKVVASDPSPDADFGVAVDVSDGTAIVGATGDDQAGTEAGAAYVFVRNDLAADDWTQVQKLMPLSPPDSAYYGLAVAIDRDTALVGAYTDHGATFRSGAAYLYQRNQGGPDAWGLVTELVPSGLMFQDFFGYSVALDGNLAVVGAWGDDDLGDRTGATFLFSRHHGGRNNWGLVAKLVGHEAEEQFGKSVATDGSFVVVGAPLNDDLALNAGAAYVYERNAGGTPDGWGLVATLTAEADAGASADFGADVEIAGNRVAVGSPYDTTNGTTYPGVVYVFEQNQGGADAWGRIAKVFPAYGASDYGADVAMTEVEVISGGPRASYFFTQSGRAYVHRLRAPESNLSVVKTDGSAVTTPGTTAIYSIAVANAGPDAVVGAVLTDVLDPVLFDEPAVSWSCLPDPGSGSATGCPSSGDAADLAAGVAIDLEAGDAVTLTLTAPVLLAAQGELTNTATVDLPFDVFDPDVADNASTDTNSLRELDYGDAPDPSYPTLSSSNGAVHGVDPLVRLGANADGELDGQPDLAATGDDDDGSNDDDGVVFRSALMPGAGAEVDIEAGAAAVASAWVDFNVDGDWDDAGEQVLSDAAVTAGVNRFSIPVPAGAVLGSTVARFRISSSSGLGVTGLAVDGEVEDYRIEIVSAAVEPLIAFTATNRGADVHLQWVNPEAGYDSTIVRVSEAGFPAGPGDGDLVVDDDGSPGGIGAFTHSGLTPGTTQYYSAFVSDGGGGFSVASTTDARPFTNNDTDVAWVYNTSASTLAPSAPLPGIGHFAVSNDRMLHAMTAGVNGGVWPAGWIPPAMNAPAQGRGPVLELPTTTVRGADTIALAGSQDGRVYAFDAETGARLWSSSALGGEVQAAPSLYLMDFGGAFDLVVAATRNALGDSKVVGLNLFDGSVEWEFDNGGGANAIGIISSQVSVDAASSPPRIFFGSRRHSTGSSSTVWCLQFTATSASRVWSVDIGNVDGSPILRNSTLYVGDNDGEVHALYPDWGGEIWSVRYTTGDGPVKDYVWFDTATSRLYFSTTTKVHAITDTGSAALQYWVPAVPVASGPSVPLLAGDRVFVGDGDGNLVEIDATITDPTPVLRPLRNPAAAFTVGSPSLDGVESQVIVGASTGEIFAVSLSGGGRR